jgi:hypothetical protein
VDSQLAWTWDRLGRITVFAALILALADVALAPVERGVEARAWSGALQNAPGPEIADATRFMLLETDAARRKTAIAVVGSSITFGANLAADETLPAQLAAWLTAAGQGRPVFNCAQAGGGSRTSVPVAAAFGTHPVSLLMVEVQLPNYIEHERVPLPSLSSDEIALVEAASPAQAEILWREGPRPPQSEFLETALASQVRRAWRLYRLRGSLWWDPFFTPPYLVWSIRRELAESGFLPKRFQGQSTNVGRLPWRKAYVNGQLPGPNQRLSLPSARLSEPEYADLRLTAELARAAGVPVVFFEVPLNLAFQRAFNLMGEEDFLHLEQARSAFVAQMMRDGLEFLPAPTLPDDGFLDRAHLTSLGAQILAQNLGESVLQHVSGLAEVDPTNRR